MFQGMVGGLVSWGEWWCYVMEVEKQVVLGYMEFCSLGFYFGGVLLKDFIYLI